MRNKKKRIVIVSGILVGLALVLREVYGNMEVSNILMVAGAIVAGYDIALNALRALRYRILGIDALVTIAVIGAFFIGEYFEAAAVTFLFTFGSYLESMTLEKTRSAIRSLLDLAPVTARVVRDGNEVVIPVDEVVEGDTVVVKPGEKIPVDGRVMEGSAYVNQAAITGESMPVSKMEDDKVFQGTVIESGFLIAEAERVGDDTTFARIIEMVEEAQDKKAKTQKFLERFSSFYTPAIMVLSLFVYLVTRDLALAITLLVIACPGALVISTPVSLVAGIGNGAKNGVLVKGGEIVEKLAKVQAIAFDKTGTLTAGKPEVTKVVAFDRDEKALLFLAADLEKYSEHPLGRAVIRKAKAEESYINRAEQVFENGDIEIRTGEGIVAKSGEQVYLIGNRRLLESKGITLDAKMEADLLQEQEHGQTVLFVAKGTQIAGIISIADTIREDAKELIAKLRKKGVKKIIMLTGDNEAYAKAVSADLGLDGYYAELMPEDKVAAIKELKEKYRVVAMVGDGVNDAPALATADIGIAIGGAGSDVAMETADVVLMSAEIRKLSYAVGIAKATVGNMKQNIGFAIVIVTLLLMGVLGKVVFLSSGMLVHEISVILVILNAIRLLSWKEAPTNAKRREREESVSSETGKLVHSERTDL
ncbi:MAG TPA: cation-translocating P-type ATPase [Clostridiaceae bacterium]|nr:cation-translocating P-type ATPase [Clostridiaceae bacterium]